MIACSALPQTEYVFPETEETHLSAAQAPAKLPAVLPVPDPLRPVTLPQRPNRWAPTVPPYSLRLGVCAGTTNRGAAIGPESGTGAVPLYLDLQNPRTGSILVTGDEGCGKTRLMQSMVAQALRDHSHRELQAAVIATHERKWDTYMRRFAPGRHFRAVPDGGWPAERVCLELASLVEQRLEGDPTGPVILLVIDGLVPMLGSSHNVQASLRFLIDQGPLVRVRPIMSLTTHQALNLHYWVSLFRTSLIGQIASPAEVRAHNAPLLAAGIPLDALTGCPGQFVAVGPAAGEPARSIPGWTRFWMVEPEGTVPVPDPAR